MKRFGIILALGGIILTTVIASQSAHALDFVITEEHEQHIRQNCVTTQTTLRQIFDNDIGLRKDRGALYEDVSTKLMAPLNSRVALNKLDGLKLTSITLQFDEQLDIFRTSYTDYAKSMERTVSINCANNPAEFYESVWTSREKRQKLHQDNQALVSLLNTYKNEFDFFAKELKGDT